VKNVGLAQAGASTTKYYLVSSVDGSRTDMKGPATVPNVPALNAGQIINDVQTLTIRTETTPGTYRVQACADGKKDVVESNEDDNCLTSSGTIKVTGLPDLTVTDVTVKNAPLTVKRGGSLIITVSVKNIGEGDAAASTTKFLLANSSAVKNLTGTVAAPLLRGNVTNTVTKTVTVLNETPLGTYAVRACADSLDVVVEALETNNCLDTAVNVTVVAQ